MSRLHVVYALAMACIFGAGWVFGKSATAHFSPMFLAAARFGLAGVCLVAVAGWPRVALGQLVFVSSTALALPYGLSYIGLRALDVSTTVLLVQLEAPILIVLSAALLREKPSTAAIVGVALAVAGVVLVVGAPSVSGQGTAIAIVLASMVVWSIGQIRIRRFGLDAGGLKLLGAACLIATPQLVGLSLLFEAGQWDQIRTASRAQWGQIAYLGLGMTVLGQGAWFFLVARHPLSHVAPFLLLVPVFAIAGGVVLLGETLPWTTFAGGAIILVGVACATLNPVDIARRIRK